MNSQIAYRASTVRIDEMLRLAAESRRAVPPSQAAVHSAKPGLVARLRRPAVRLTAAR
jgi:hypothetical protein